MPRTLVLIAPLLLVGCASSSHWVTDMLGYRPKSIEIVEVADLDAACRQSPSAWNDDACVYGTPEIARVYVRPAPTRKANERMMKQPPDAPLDGTLATGRVAQVYVKVAENVYFAVDRAPPHLRDSAERWIDVEFPDMLANDTGSARAMLSRSDLNVAVGDVVEVKFAHKDNPRYFPVKELTRVTEFVASKDQMLARDMERRILARNGNGNAGPQWLSQGSAVQPVVQSLQTTSVNVAR